MCAGYSIKHNILIWIRRETVGYLLERSWSKRRAAQLCFTRLVNYPLLSTLSLNLSVWKTTGHSEDKKQRMLPNNPLFCVSLHMFTSVGSSRFAVCRVLLFTDSVEANLLLHLPTRRGDAHACARTSARYVNSCMFSAPNKMTLSGRELNWIF